MKFHIAGRVTITVTTTLEASDEAVARAIAAERPMSGSWRDDGSSTQEWVHDDLDGEPEVLTVTPLT